MLGPASISQRVLPRIISIVSAKWWLAGLALHTCCNRGAGKTASQGQKICCFQEPGKGGSGTWVPLGICCFCRGRVQILAWSEPLPPAGNYMACNAEELHAGTLPQNRALINGPLHCRLLLPWGCGCVSCCWPGCLPAPASFSSLPRLNPAVEPVMGPKTGADDKSYSAEM